MPQKNLFALVQLAAAHAYLGDASAAAQALAQARELRPSISLRELVAVIPHAHQEALDHLLEGFRKAGLAE
jgi:adenylate cyclase